MQVDWPLAVSVRSFIAETRFCDHKFATRPVSGFMIMTFDETVFLTQIVV